MTLPFAVSPTNNSPPSGRVTSPAKVAVVVPVAIVKTSPSVTSLVEP